MLRLWLTPKWLALTAFSLAFAVACYFLGVWQWSRYEEKATKAHAIETNYDAAPQPLEVAWTPSLSEQSQWRHVTLTGRYLPEHTLLTRNRPFDGVYGYEVLTPVQAGARVVLVDRGWVPNAATAETVPVVAAPPTGEVTLTGWLKSGEESLERTLPEGQVASINIPDAAEQVPALDPADAYVVLGRQEPPNQAGEGVPQVLPRPEVSLGVNQAYAVQWWITMPFAFVFTLITLRKAARAADPAQDGRSVGRSATTPRPSRPKKVRIWDEEDA